MLAQLVQAFIEECRAGVFSKLSWCCKLGRYFFIGYPWDFWIWSSVRDESQYDLSVLLGGVSASLGRLLGSSIWVAYISPLISGKTWDETDQEALLPTEINWRRLNFAVSLPADPAWVNANHRSFG